MTQQAFYGLSTYTANAAGFNATVFINTPITADTNGNVHDRLYKQERRPGVSEAA